MADPLSISVSVLALLGSGISVTKALHSVISKYINAPAAILALSNELSDLLLVFQEIRDRSLTSATATNLSSILQRADSKLQELDLFVKDVGVLGTGKVGRRRYEKLSWAAKNSKKAAELKQDLHDLKINIILLLSTVAMSQLQLAHRNTSVVRSISVVNNVEMEEAAASPKSQQALIRSLESKPISNAVAFQVKPQRKACNDWCSCICHRRSKFRSPCFLDNFLGTLQLAFGGIPMITQSCSQSSCWQQTVSTTSVMYHFPSWLVNRALCIAFINSIEPTASLKIPRIIDPKAEIFEFTRNRNLEGVRKLLEERKASPNDIKGDYSRRSVLHDALCFKSLEICKLLIKAGADLYIPDHREETAIEKIHLNSLAVGRRNEYGDRVLNPWTPNELAEFTGILHDTSFMLENNFSRLHKAVFQAQLGKLREELEISTKDIDQTDGQGYTPLDWAAVRMDPECLDMLLHYGANLKPYASRARPILFELAAQNFLDDNMKKKRNQCLEIAINYGKAIFGQDYVDQPYEGSVALIKACQHGHPSGIPLFLDAGANINLEDRWGRTPLSAPITNIITGTEALSLILKNSQLNRILSRKAMLNVLECLYWRSDKEILSKLVQASLSCPDLKQRDWIPFEKPRLKHSSDYNVLWEQLISDLKL